MIKLNIGIISTTIYPLKCPFEGYAGIEKLVSEKAVKLAEFGHDVTVFAPKGSNLGDKVKIVETVEPTINYSPLHEREACKIINEYLKTNDLDIIEDNTHQKYIYLYKAKHPELNVCSVLHNQCNFTNPPPGVKHMNLIGISDYHCSEASGILGIHLERVYNGIDIEKLKYNENKEDYFLFFSRISRFKGAHEAIEACKRSNVKLKVAGEDVFVNDPAYVMSVMQSCDGKMIKYLGNVSEDKKVELLSNAKALILPLLWNEPFGIIFLEALASGTPIITYPRGSVPEILKHRKEALFCYNTSEIASAIKIIDTEINPKNCLERAKQFTVEEMSKNYEKLYERILNGDEW